MSTDLKNSQPPCAEGMPIPSYNWVESRFRGMPEAGRKSGGLRELEQDAVRSVGLRPNYLSTFDFGVAFFFSPPLVFDSDSASPLGRAGGLGGAE